MPKQVTKHEAIEKLEKLKKKYEKEPEVLLYLSEALEQINLEVYYDDDWVENGITEYDVAELTESQLLIYNNALAHIKELKEEHDHGSAQR